jgi:hypothetical protein
MINDPSSPILRATILAEVIKQAALVPGPATKCAIFKSVINALGMSEEECGLEITSAVALLVLSGILECNTEDRIRGEIIFSVDTVLTPSRRLINFMWSEYGEADSDEIE